MPSTARARPLHCGTCINDLAKKCEVVFDNKNPKLVCNSLKKLLSEGKKHRSNGDDEMAYIYLMRWLNCIRWLKKTPDCNQNKDFLKPYVSGSEVKDILNILEDITGRLEERYKAKRLKDCTKRIVDDVEKIQLEPEHANNDDLLDEVADIELNLPDTPTDDPVNRATETSITCMEMFHEMQKLGNRIIIFDIRSQENFQSSQIKGNRCVNIPADIIKPGISATNLFRSLNADQKTCQIISHRARAYCDLIVLLDWQTSKSSLKPANRLVVLKKILWDWDPGVAYQKIVVLDGGYKEWLNCFPAYTTNPSIIIPDITSNSIAEILEDVEYPDWVQSDEDQPAMKVQFKPVAERNLKPMITVKQDFIIKKSNTLHNENSEHTNSTGILSNDSISPSKFRADFPNDNFIDATSADTSPLKTAVNNLKLNHNSTVHNLINKPTEDEVSKPAIDRSSKPNTVKIYDADSEKMLNLLKQHSELVKSKMKLEDEKLLLEDQLFGREENEDNNSKQKVETLRHIEVLHATIIQKMKQIVDIKQKVNECKKQSIKVNPAHYDEEVLLQLNLGIAEHEAQTAAIRRRMFITERDKKLEENLEMREASISTPPKDSEMDTQKKTPQQDGTSMNGALKRSHSSPNLAQLETRKDSIGQGFDYKVPQVDRTSKPSHQQLQHGSNITNSTIVHRQPLRRDREQRMSPVFGNMHPGITGLKNLGNSCYMNSIIQCLSNTTSLARYFIQGFYTDDLITKNKKTQGQVVEEVAQVIKALWCGHYRSISPRDLKVAIGQYKLQFESYEQQDSHEFLTFLLDWMHNDLKTKAKMDSDRLTSNAEKEWDKAMDGQTSIISQLFFGQLRSTITCATCGNSSTTYESFNSLTLSLPDTLRCTLDDCIRKYVSGQRVSGWRCPSCKATRDATKKFDFVKLAPIIVVHLNRFGETGGWIQKINTAVDFPLMSLDLRSYVAHDCGSMTTNTNSYHQTYNLYAVSNHYGTMEGGHYTAYCNSASQNKWYKYDDHAVREVSLNEVKSQTASAYLLFYTSVPNSPYMVM